MSSQRSDWRERLHANPSRMEIELAVKLQEEGILCQTQVEIPITTADFYFPTQSRQLIVFVDGRVHLGKTQMIKDEELRTPLRKKGYRVLELSYNGCSDSKKGMRSTSDHGLSETVVSAHATELSLNTRKVYTSMLEMWLW